MVVRDKFIKRMEIFSNDQNKFQKTAAKEDDFLNFIISQEKYIDKIHKKLFGSKSIPEETQRCMVPAK